MVAVAAGVLTACKGRGTKLAWGFAALRMHFETLHCAAEEWSPQASRPDAGNRCATDPVQLLCRALRLAPECYRRFELTAARPDAALRVEANVVLSWNENACWDEDDKVYSRGEASFDSVAQLAAAMQRCAAEEGIEVALTSDDGTIIVRRAGVPPAAIVVHESA